MRDNLSAHPVVQVTKHRANLKRMRRNLARIEKSADSNLFVLDENKKDMTTPAAASSDARKPS